MKIALGTIHKRRLLLGGGRGVQEMTFWGDFQGLTEKTGGGRVVQNFKRMRRRLLWMIP